MLDSRFAARLPARPPAPTLQDHCCKIAAWLLQGLLQGLLQNCCKSIARVLDSRLAASLLQDCPPARPRHCFKMIAAKLLQGCCKNAARLATRLLQECSKVAARLTGQLLEFSCSFWELALHYIHLHCAFRSLLAQVWATSWDAIFQIFWSMFVILWTKPAA